MRFLLLLKYYFTECLTFTWVIKVSLFLLKCNNTVLFPTLQMCFQWKRQALVYLGLVLDVEIFGYSIWHWARSTGSLLSSLSRSVALWGLNISDLYLPTYQLHGGLSNKVKATDSRWKSSSDISATAKSGTLWWFSNSKAQINMALST